MNIYTLKNKLLDLELFINNEYLDLYCNLIYKNLSNKKQKFKTQLHHIIPRAYYKSNNLKLDNSKSNTVNLLYKDHILAHCYLVLCSKESDFKYKMMSAVYKILGAKFIEDKDDLNKLILESDIYQKAYEESRKINYEFNPMNIVKSRQKHDNTMRSKDVRDKISKSMIESRKNSDKKIHIYLNKESKRVSEQDLNYYLNKGWKKGNPKGMLYINMNNIDKKIWPEELDEYLNKGWVKGRYKRDSFKIPRKKPEGFHQSKDFKDKQSKALKSFYQNNPDWKTKSKKAVKIFKDNIEYCFNSCKELYQFLEMYGYESSGLVAIWVRAGFISRKNCIYYGWRIEYI